MENAKLNASLRNYIDRVTRFAIQNFGINSNNSLWYQDLYQIERQLILRIAEDCQRRNILPDGFTIEESYGRGNIKIVLDDDIVAEGYLMISESSKWNFNSITPTLDVSKYVSHIVWDILPITRNVQNKLEEVNV